MSSFSRSRLRAGRWAALVLFLSVVRPGSAEDLGYPAPPDTWTATGQLAHGHTNGALAALDSGGALLVGGTTGVGLNGTFTSPYAELFDPLTRTWKSYPDPGAPPPLVPAHGSGANAVTLADGNVLIIGGLALANDGIVPPGLVTEGNNFATARCDIYRPATNDWVRTADLPVPIAHNVAVGVVRLADDRVLHCGGAFAESMSITTAAVRPTATKKCFIYDPVLASWTRVADMHVPRTQIGRPILLPDGRVVIVAGEAQIPNTGVRWNTAEVYDPAADAWTLYPPMPGFADEDGRFAGLQDADSPQIGSRGRTSVGLLPDGRVLIVAGQGQAWLNEGTRSGAAATIGARQVLMNVYNVNGFTAADTGKSLVVSGAGNAGNNSAPAGFKIAHVLNTNAIVVENLGAVAFDETPVSWSVAGSNPLRSGTGASIGNTFVRYRITGLSGLSGLVANVGPRHLRLGTQGAWEPTNPADTANQANRGFKVINRVISDSEAEVNMAPAEDDFVDTVADRSDAHNGTIAWQVSARSEFTRTSSLIFDADNLAHPWTPTARTSISVGEPVVLPHACGGGLIRVGGANQIPGVIRETFAAEAFDPTSETWSSIADLPHLADGTAYAVSQGSSMRSQLLRDGTLLLAAGGASATTDPPSQPVVTVIGKDGDPRGGVLYAGTRLGVRVAHIRPSTASGYTAGAPLSVTVSGNDIKVNLATGSDTLTTSTASDVVAAVTAASTLVTAAPIQGQDGQGLANTTGVSVQGGTFLPVQSSFRGAFVYTPAPVKDPTLTLAGDNAAVVIVGSSYSDAGAMAVDSCGALLVPAVVVNSVNSAAIGTYAVTYLATDSVGHTATATRVVEVEYAPAGATCRDAPGHQILPPINADGSSRFNRGSVVAAAFRVCGVDGGSIGAPTVSSLYLVRIGGSTLASPLAVASATAHDAFRWDVAGQKWIFNIDTKGAVYVANQTYGYEITLNDGTTIDFALGLK